MYADQRIAFRQTIVFHILLGDVFESAFSQGDLEKFEQRGDFLRLGRVVHRLNHPPGLAFAGELNDAAGILQFDPGHRFRFFGRRRLESSRTSSVRFHSREAIK
jgi:hypothetical protein